MSSYKTNYSKVITNLFSFFINFLGSTWRTRSLSMLSILSGYLVTSSLFPLLIYISGYRYIGVIFIVAFVEVLVRTRLSKSGPILKSLFILIDNFRIGITYAIVLEAFKLGS